MSADLGWRFCVQPVCLSAGVWGMCVRSFAASPFLMSLIISW